MATFTPPIVFDVPPVSCEPNMDRVAFRLMRHYRQRPRGVNIFYLTNGTATAAQPTDAEDIAVVWYGGHGSYEVTDTQAAALVEAGYDVEGYP